jgi:hypothetical protein
MKAQVEIFGLVIIVILLSLGLLFAVVVLTRPPAVEEARVKESVLAANFLNTMLGTTTYCQGRTVRDLLQNCALAPEDWTGALFCEDVGMNVCEYANETIRLMLERTLGTWGKDYTFFVNNSPAVGRIKIWPPCVGEREGSSRPEKVRPGFDIILNLQLCQES